MQKDVGKAIIIIIIILMGSMLGNGGVSKRTPRDLRKAF
jgi:LPS O-antigen subunit length determinant protein (WzzB/FepE family)